MSFNVTRGPGEGQAVWVPGHKVICKANGEETGGAYSLLEVIMTGQGPPQHIHKAEDEAFMLWKVKLLLEGVKRR